MAESQLVGLPPIIGQQTRVLVLGSFPGVASLRAAQYYGHPQNHFWRILSSIWPEHSLPESTDYAARCEWLIARRLGVWDVYAACEREGSLDTSIRNARVNDFAALQKQLPQLAAIAHNGGESFRHAKAVRRSMALSDDDPIASLRLPSTSPANASWSFEKKLNAWRDALATHGLV